MITPRVLIGTSTSGTDVNPAVNALFRLLFALSYQYTKVHYDNTAGRPPFHMTPRDETTMGGARGITTTGNILQ